MKDTYVFRGEMVKTPALYSKGRRFEPHRRRFFTPTVVLLSFNKPETVLWTIAKILLLYMELKNLELAPTNVPASAYICDVRVIIHVWTT